jgi:hypothetical protein
MKKTIIAVFAAISTNVAADTLMIAPLYNFEQDASGVRLSYEWDNGVSVQPRVSISNFNKHYVQANLGLSAELVDLGDTEFRVGTDIAHRDYHTSNRSETGLVVEFSVAHAVNQDLTIRAGVEHFSAFNTKDNRNDVVMSAGIQVDF